MAKYHSSPIGIIRGKLGPFIFQYSKGRRIIRMMPPKERLTRDDIPHINERFIFAAVGYLFKLLKPIIYTYWKEFAARKKQPYEFNLFLKYNIPPLYHSIPDTQKLLSEHNYPDIKRMTITYGGFLQDSAQITAMAYENGMLNIRWNTTTYGNGKPEDDVHIIVLYWKQEKINKNLAHERPWRKINFWYFNAKRGDAQMSMKIQEGLCHSYIVAYIFFTNKKSYSQSTAATIT